MRSPCMTAKTSARTVAEEEEEKENVRKKILTVLRLLAKDVGDLNHKLEES